MSTSSSKPPTLPRGCGWTLLGIAVLSLLIGLLSFAATGRVWQRSEEVWIETPAKVVESYVERGERKSPTTTDGVTRNVKRRAVAVTFTVMLRYDYTAGGNTHRGEEKSLEQPADDEDYSLAAPILEQFPPGKEIAVFHHPKDVERSRLSAKEPRREVVFDLIFAALFTVVGFIGILAGRAVLKRRGSERT